MAVSFGRQKNLVRRAVRPDSRVNRDLRRRGVGKNTLLDLKSAKPSLSLRLAKMIARLFGR
jgi:hypothetical protein